MKSSELPDEDPIRLSPALLSSITTNTPSVDLSTPSATLAFSSLKLADPDLGKPGRIDLLLGLDVLSKIGKPRWISAKDTNLFAHYTIFGWVVGGTCANSSQAARVHVCCKATTKKDLNNSLRAFWVIEEPPSNISNLSPEEQSAVEQFPDSVSHNSERRYIVALPCRDSAPPLGASRPQAMRRFQQNWTSLTKRGRWEDFQRAVAEYGELGHAEPVPLQDLSKPPEESYYMPMHGVVKETSTTTKLRVVFDASTQITTDYSLNSTVLPELSLYPLLSDILIRFRTHSIGISSDISKIFREIQLQPQE